MALPVAPLGQLPSMNMPYSIPTYEKGPSIWEKALAAFLVNAAGNAASQGVENFMSRDYAKEFGEKPAGGFSRLVSGPVVDSKEATRRRAEDAAMQQQNFEIDSKRKAVEQAQAFERSMATQKYADDTLMQQDRDRAAMDRLNAELSGRGSLLDREAQQATDLAQLKAELEAGLLSRDPRVSSQVRLDDARAAEAGAQARRYGADAAFTEDIIRRRTGTGQPPPQASTTSSTSLPPDITPAMRDYLMQQSTGLGSDVPPDLDLIQRFLETATGGDFLSAQRQRTYAR